MSPPDSHSRSYPCPTCGRPTADGLPCENCAPDQATEPTAIPAVVSYATRARYVRAGFWGALLCFPVVAWIGAAPLFALSRLLDDGRYVMQWYEWYTLPGQTLAVFLYSWSLWYLNRWARWYERYAARLCGRCSFPLLGGDGRCANCGLAYAPEALGD
jgi:hypothetical protein